MTFIVGHNNKCHIYRSVGGSAIYITMLLMFKLFFLKEIPKKMLTLHYNNGSLCQTKFTTNLYY